jgi:hypothetical protein
MYQSSWEETKYTFLFCVSEMCRQTCKSNALFRAKRIAAKTVTFDVLYGPSSRMNATRIPICASLVARVATFAINKRKRRKLVESRRTGNRAWIIMKSASIGPTRENGK